MKGCLGWLVAIAVVLGGLYWWSTRPAEDLRIAASGGKVTIAAVAGDANRAMITVTRGSATGGLIFRLPAGTILSGGGSNAQRQITANSVTIIMAASETEIRQEVETFCLDQFKIPPPPTTSLTLDLAVDQGGSSDAGEEGVSETAKLAACLEHSTGTSRDRQVAIWLVKEGFIAKSYDDARREAIASLSRELESEMRQKISTELAARLRQASPTMSEDEIHRQERRFSSGALSGRVRTQAEHLVDKSFADVRSGVGPALQGCSYDTASLKFFQTAPA
jgi:hypothetical protein